MTERAELKPCPHCGGKVDAFYEGSSDWAVYHLDADGRISCSAVCTSSTTIHVRASRADWENDVNAEYNKVVAIWNRREPL